MDSRSALFSFPDPYDLEGSRSLFLQAIEENVRFHYNACPEYRKIAQARGFSPHPLQTERELAELPIPPTILFKRHNLRSMEGKNFLSPPLLPVLEEPPVPFNSIWAGCFAGCAWCFGWVVTIISFRLFPLIIL